MTFRVARRRLIGWMLSVGGAVWLVGLGVSCDSAPQAVFVQGPGGTENERPTLEILEPSADITRDQGAVFSITWVDSDRDSNASISFRLVNTITNASILIAEQIDENDTSGPDGLAVGTSAVPVGTYNLVGVIDDDVNDPVQVFAMTVGTTPARRVVITIVPPGQGQLTEPPQVVVMEPAVNLSVAQDDILRVTVQPTEIAGDTVPFDRDSDATLFILLDTDLNPNNDEPNNDDPESNLDDPNIIVLRRQTITQNSNAPITFDIPIDLSVVPPRSGGAPYFIRATVVDVSNPPVHQYAVGTISVVELASGIVDLSEIGKVKAGATWYGFNPGGLMGSTIRGIGDFDSDGVEDFVIVAQKGNPHNFGLIGEAYLVYGIEGTRFGGSIAVNSVSDTISGVIFEAPPVRQFARGRTITGSPVTNGIVSIDIIRDLTGDGRPELLFGLSRVHGAFDSLDWDPEDQDPQADATEDVEVVIREGEAEITEGDDETVQESYVGNSDTTISSALASASMGSSDQLSWVNDPGAGVTEWTLIKLANILSLIPNLDDLQDIDITSVQAMLEFQVVDPGGGATVHEVLSPFTEQTTYNSFAANGGAPQAGVDYVTEALGTLSADSFGTQEVDVSSLVQRLILGQLSSVNNELRFILVPGNDEEAANRAAVVSSEPGNNRPTLRINFSRLNAFSFEGCYPDNLVNNKTDTDDGDGLQDFYFYAGGMAVVVNSQNRDNRGLINPDRLEATSVALELVGQQGDRLRLLGDVEFSDLLSPDADNAAAGGVGDTSEENRIAGARLVAGHYDFIDHARSRQGGREGLFGQTVSSIGDLNNDGVDEIVVSAPTNERYLFDLARKFGPLGTQLNSTIYDGSIAIFPGRDYNATDERDKEDDSGTSTTPFIDQHEIDPFGSCSEGIPRHLLHPLDSFSVFAEDIDDMLGGATSAGDFNQDGLDDILCGAYLNDRDDLSTPRIDSGAVYILYGRSVIGNFDLTRADSVLLRPPMLRVRGVKSGDQIGWRQTSGLDVNGDRIGDVFISSPRTDYGGILRSSCSGDFNRDGVTDESDLTLTAFSECQERFVLESENLFSDDPCKVFDYDNDRDIDTVDRSVFNCLSSGSGDNCCSNLVDNGFIGIIFGGVFVDGDRSITQIATPDLPGTKFFGSGVGHHAGTDISSAGDFNKDGFGDLLISVPGETRVDTAGRERLGVVYLVFGGPYLENTEWNLSQVGTSDLPGIVFLSPFVKGRPNEAPPMSVALLGDVNNDGFDDVCIGNPSADFIDQSFPQGPDAPGGDAAVGRRRNSGQAYLIYGNNFGSNRRGR